MKFRLNSLAHERVQTYLASFKNNTDPRLNIYKHIPKEYVKK